MMIAEALNYLRSLMSLDAGQRLHFSDDVPIAIDVVRDANGRDISDRVRVHTELLDELDRRADAPRVRRGELVAHSLPSLRALLVRHGDERSTVWCDARRGSAVVVFDDDGHSSNDSLAAGWRGFRATWEATRSPELGEWGRVDGRDMSQEALADFLDERSGDFVETSHAGRTVRALDVVALVRDLSVTTISKCRRAVDPVSGVVALSYSHEQTEGQIRLPPRFRIMIPAFANAEIPIVLDVRLSFRIADNVPTFRLDLVDADRVIRDAHEQLADHVRRVVAEPTEPAGPDDEIVPSRWPFFLGVPAPAATVRR